MKFLIEQGIDSISLNEDAVLKTLLSVAKIEDELGIRSQKTSQKTVEADRVIFLHIIVIAWACASAI